MRFIFTLFLALIYNALQAQISDSLDYQGNLPTLKSYQGEPMAELIQACEPCIMEYYNSGKELVFRGLQYSDCLIGWFEKFDTQGNLIEKGQYYPLQDQEGDYCSVPDGTWYYLSRVNSGDTLYTETWDRGEFIEQSPALKKVELWDVKLFKADSTEVDGTLSFTDFKGLSCVPQYKNSVRPNTLRIHYVISAGDQAGTHGMKNIISFDGKLNNIDLAQIDLAKIRREHQMLTKELTSMRIEFIMDGKLIWTEYLNFE